MTLHRFTKKKKKHHHHHPPRGSTVTLNSETELTLIITGVIKVKIISISAVFDYSGHLLHLQFLAPAAATAVVPRWRDDAVVRVVGAEHGDLAAKRTTRGDGLSGRLVHHQGKDEIGRRTLGEGDEGILGPSLDRGCQFPVGDGTLAVHSDSDKLVELAEKLERNLRDLEFTD